jgi:hypothetical protein
LEVQWTKVKDQQAKEPLPVLSMNAMAKALKVMQGLVLNERETNAQLSMELKEAHKEKGPNQAGKSQRP